MENMFLDAMDKEIVSDFQETKLNKEFGLKLINDLRNVFHIYDKVEDNPNYSIVYTKKAANHNYYGANTFTFDKEGIKFRCHLLCYPSMAHVERLKGVDSPLTMFNKYKEHEMTKADNAFMSGTLGHLDIAIDLKRDDVNLREKLKDIATCFQIEGYSKKF